MKYYIIAGEASGDLHGSNLIKALRRRDAAAEFRFWGGDLMEQAAQTPPVKHYRQLAFMGFWEVAKNLRTILRNLSFCKKDILAYQPAVLILIDYPGFNMRIADFARKQGLRVAYYVAPQIWAWRPSRAHRLRKTVDLMLAILPFEPEFYQRYGITAHFVGHPLLDAIETSPHHATDAAPIALLPGSRQQEIATMLPLMLDTAAQLPQEEFIVAGTALFGESHYTAFNPPPNVRIIIGKTYEILKNAKAALVTSGTATLETALWQVPQVVCYKGSAISYAIDKRLVQVRFISLVNLIMDKMVVRELIQKDCTAHNLKAALQELLQNPEYYEKIQEDYRNLHHQLGGAGAAERAAEKIINLAANKNLDK